MKRLGWVSAMAVLLMTANFAFVQPVSAQSSCVGAGGSAIGESGIEEYVATPEQPYALEQPFGGKATIANLGEYIQLIYQFSLGIIGIIAVVLIMFGGLRWVAAAGNESTIGEAKEIISSAVVGLLIALLSYTILLTINPQFVNTDLNIFKIPVPAYCPNSKEVVSATIETTPNLLGNGHQLCVGAAAELKRIAAYMEDGGDGPGGNPGTCPGCKIGVSSGLRTHEKQQELRSCYERAVASGVKDGSSCPSGCSTCNAACPVCTSNHEQGSAVDLWLQDYVAAGADVSSQGKLRQQYNPGGSASTPSLTLNQNKLKEIMQNTPSSKFKGIGNEWWHFDFSGDCDTVPYTCRSVSGGSVAANAYCEQIIVRGGIDVTTYGPATCNGTSAVCSSGALITDAKCEVGSHMDVVAGSAIEPTCVKD